MAAPDAPIVSGTGGLRKTRFTGRKWKRGKSGAVRVCYAYFQSHWTVLLIMAYGKGTKDSLTANEKAGIKKYLERIEQYLEARIA